ncbi:copper chaperone CopZ [Pontibacter ummariensis]|uniref:Copper chaperone CopZ n=1 Tax=Pontibacter ummariensis TaxID=1610492 RepID=A0A239DP70_9BACT|nr:heavy metal-associated domain-containing protein [Pontibacter ummariensis]PRY13814.1 copper chaperone CopZ [Pontibacter ummariensis]SNS34445.1 Copper chaperone CopZ [Pontibacter ummariensis]
MEKENQNKSQSGSIVEENFPIGGMTCSGCANSVKRSLTKLEGVKSAEVNLSDASAKVAYDSNAVTPAQMQEAVETIGFKFDRRKS